MPQIVDIPGVGEVEFPDSMTDEQITEAIRTKILPSVQEPQAEQRGFVDELGRQLGLTGRAIAQNIAAIPAMVAQPLADVADMGLEAAGSDFRFGNQAAGLSNLLTQVGLPEPENATERVVQDAAGALTAGGAVVGTAQRLSGPLARQLAALPGRQAAGAAAAGASAGAVREEGGGELAQAGAGLAGGLLASNPELAARGAMAAGRIVPAMFRPFTQAGREQVVGNLLADQATDPARALSNLRNAGEIVPGSIPTTGAASRDAGLLALEKGARARRPGEFGARLSEQNAARQQALDEIAGTPSDIADDIAAREAATAALREEAFANARAANVQKAVAKADEILASPAGARKPVQQAIGEFRDTIANETDPARLYAVRQDIGDALAGKFGGEKASMKLASKELIALRDALDDVIDDAAPGFKAYLQRYREMSKPINQKEALQELQARSALAAPDITTGRDFLSQAKFTRNLDNLMRDRLVAGSLTDEQVRTAKAIAADLDLGASINSSLIRAPGSDTFQNYSLAGVIGAARSRSGDLPPFLQTLLKPLAFLYRASDDRIDDLLTQAMLDPKLAARLMARPTKNNVTALAVTLKRDAIRAYGQGAALGASQSTREPERQGTGSR